VPVTAVGRGEGHADRGVKSERDIVDRDGEGDGVAQTSGDLECDLVRGDLRNEHGEFVATESGDRAAGRKRPGQSAPDLHEDIVACVVTHRVVYLLELVQVDKHDRGNMIGR
jgi:hypothetical protein